MAGKAYGRFKIYGHDILFKKKILHIGASCVCVCMCGACQSNPQP